MRVIKAKIEIETNLSPAQIETLLGRLNEPGVRVKSVALTVPRHKATIYDLRNEASVNWAKKVKEVATRLNFDMGFPYI
jgi:hypothetical protein